MSILDVRTKPAKVFNISTVANDVIPWSTCDRLLWPLAVLEFINKIKLSQLETKVCHHLSVLGNNLFGLRKLKGFEEVGKILIDVKLFFRHGETPLEKDVFWYDGGENDNESTSHTHDEKW